MGLVGFSSEENSARRFLIVHAEQRRHVIPLHASAFDLHDDFAPLVLGLVEIQQAVHAICTFAVAFRARAGVNQRQRPLLELPLVQFRQRLRAAEIRGLAFFLKFSFIAESVFEPAFDKIDGEVSDSTDVTRILR